MTNSSNSPNSPKQQLNNSLARDRQTKEALVAYLRGKLADAQAAAGAVDEIIALRRAQGEVRIIKVMLRDIGADTKDAQ